MAERAARARAAPSPGEHFRTDLSVETKRDKNDLVTEADQDAQQQVLATIREEFPDDDFVCEERRRACAARRPTPTRRDWSRDPRQRRACWVVDPIDGTTNFVRQMRVWTTSVAAVVDGEAVGSATYMPAMGTSTPGPGERRARGTTMSVSEREDPRDLRRVAGRLLAPEKRDEFVDPSRPSPSASATNVASGRSRRRSPPSPTVGWTPPSARGRCAHGTPSPASTWSGKLAEP